MAAFLCPRLFLRLARPTTSELGLAGERIAERHLRRRGWRLLARRLRTVHAEVDLVFRVADGLVCVEVKTGRRGARFRPGHRLRGAALQRLLRAARELSRTAGLPARVDLFEVVLGTGGRPQLLHHANLIRPLD